MPESPNLVVEFAKLTPDIQNLPNTARLIAACWFELRGTLTSHVAGSYTDIIVDFGNKKYIKVHAITALQKCSGSWSVNVPDFPPPSANLEEHLFVIDGDLAIYLIPANYLPENGELKLVDYHLHCIGRLPALAGGIPSS